MLPPQVTSEILLWSAVASGVEGLLYVVTWVVGVAKAARAGQHYASPGFPKLLLALILLMLLCASSGLWTLYHLPKPPVCPFIPVSPPSEAAPVAQPQAKQPQSKPSSASPGQTTAKQGGAGKPSD